MNFTHYFDSVISAFQATTMIEWLIFMTALIYVALAAIENVWCWLFGILASALSVYLFYTGNLFLESCLNIFYVIIGFYGWYQWLYGSNEKVELQIQSFSFQKNVYLIIIGCIVWIPFGYVAHNYSTQVMPYLDAFITSFSIIATWMAAKKILENWIYWILINGLAVLLCSFRGFYLIALLYIIYTLLSVAGYLKWRKKIAA